MSSVIPVAEVSDRLKGEGFEIYRCEGSALHLAERVRMHIMDSGVVLTVGDPFEISFVCRVQRSDFPSLNDSELFEKVRSDYSDLVGKRGYAEKSAEKKIVNDPTDAERVLDVWFEITFAQNFNADRLLQDTKHSASPSVQNPQQPVSTSSSVLGAELQWALSLDKYVSS